jgi:23S rRNA (cytidine2498-2'-O)-methyltransferase
MLVAYVRPGFEPEAAQELTDWAARAGAHGYAKTERDSAIVRFVAEDLRAAPAWSELVFARQVLRGIAELPALDPRDRLAPMLEAIGAAYADVWVETPDSAAGAELKGLCRSFEAVFVAALRKRKLLDPQAPKRLHVCFLSGTHALLGESEVATSAPWPMGIPRLKLPAGAPSRSALKIEEAWLTLMSAAERERWLAPGMSAVDLGAAPGGWSFQLARRSIRVTAVDNGPLAASVLESGLVEHVRADGFRFRPKKNVDWVVCDMVEQPKRVATLIAQWLAEGAARAALFNLKLPMKKRWQETQLCLDLLREALPSRRSGWIVRAKQLYHDREEITVVAHPG